MLIELIEPRTLFTATIPANQQANLTKLATDLKAIHANSKVTVTELHQLGTDLATALKGATRPSAASVNALRTEISAALADGKVTAAEKATISADFSAVLVSADISQAEAKAVSTDLKTILTASGITKADVKLILADLKAIATTFEANHS